MALNPPFDQAVNPIIDLFSKFSDKLNGLQDKLLGLVNEMQQKVNNLPDDVQCADPRIQEIKDLYNELNETISKMQEIFANAQNIVNILIIIATIASVAIAISLALVLPTNNAIVKALEVSSYVVATILGIIGLISLGLNFASNKINSLSDQLGGVLEKLSNTCSNESFIINTIQRIDNVDTFADMTASEFYRTVNVSESDLSDRADKIEQLLTSQRSLIDNLIEAPSNVLSNNGIPNNNQGNQGDYYINTQNNQIYGPKLSDTNWGTPLN
jgi:hypothetical protein